MSFAQPAQFRPRTGVPLAPMIDIMFLLLIFFVTTSSFRAEEREVDVNLPAAESSNPGDATPTQIIVNVQQDGAIIIGNETYNLDALRELLKTVIRDYPNERVIIRGDRKVAYEHVVAVMDTARAAGVRNLYFATVKRASEVGG